MRLTRLTIIACAVGAPLGAQPAAWAGTYVFDADLGRDGAGQGNAIGVEHRLVVDGRDAVHAGTGEARDRHDLEQLSSRWRAGGTRRLFPQDLMQRLPIGPREWVPNNPSLPVRLYRGVVTDPDPASAFEALFGKNGWRPDWRDGVFDYHHYHSTAHEVLGCFTGRATLTISGPGGERIDLGAGDAVMLPAGTGHKREAGSDGFGVVGAYPAGQAWDIVTDPADETIRARIAAVPAPRLDPVTGAAF